MPKPDVIVLGLGAIGSAAAWRLAGRGARVIGLDRFTPLHDRGSSHGRTRICRKAYFEHPDYVPLLTRAYRLWEQIEHEARSRLFERCGLLLVDDENGPVVAGVRRAAAQHSLEIEPLTADDVRRRFPAFRIPHTQVALFERDAGYLHAERCLEAMQRRAVAAGADLRWETQVRAWRADRASVVVRTDDGVLEAGALVLCAGAWSAELLGELIPPLSVLRTVQHWFGASDPQSLTPPAFPVYGWQTAAGFFYGFPSLDGRTVKAAEHGGRPAARGADALVRKVSDSDVVSVRRFLEEHIQGVAGNPVESHVCMYTMTPDEHFIVDRHPGCERVVFACGFSGHGFKFAPLIGDVLADLVIGGRTNAPIDFLRAARFA